MTGAWGDPAVRAAVQQTIAANLFPTLECVDCDHDIDGHDYGLCDVAGCPCAREVFDDD